MRGDASRNGVHVLRHRCVPMGRPSMRSRVRAFASARRDAVVEYDTMTTPMEMFHAMQAKLRESSREYETIAEGARR